MAEKKKFFEVEIPLVEEKVDLFTTSLENLDGKTVKLDLTRKLRGKSVEAVFKLKLEEGKLVPYPISMKIYGYFIRRMMRKSISYSEDSFKLQSKDAALRVKFFMITRKKVSRAVLNALRLKAIEEINIEMKDKTFVEIFTDLLANKMQRTLSLKLKKVYPLAFFDIRDIFIEN